MKSNKEKTLLVKYDATTNLVCGNFLKGEKYNGNVINEEDKTIDGCPYIEIKESEQKFGNVVVVDGVYQEYVKTDSELLKEAVATKIGQLKAYREANICKPTPQNVTYEGNLANKSFNFSEKDVAKIGLIISFLEDSEEGTTRNWTDVDGDRASLTLANFKSLRNHYLADRDETEYNFYNKRKEAVKALTDLNAIKNYDITTTDFE